MNLRVTVLAAACLLSIPALAAGQGTLKNQKEKLSYTFGYQVGRQVAHDFKEQGIDVDPTAFTRAVKDVLTGSPTLMTEQEMMATIQSAKQEMQAKEQALAEKNKKAGDAFLKANAKKKGVKVLPSGLQYRVIKDGTGKMPKATDTVEANYKGTLIDGKEFDSSFKRGQAARFPVNGVIKGWQEALMLMKEGAKWEIFVPPDLGYGPQTRGPIPPNSVLIFEIDLLKVNPPEVQPQGK